jgi:hypothetical protein
MCKPNSQKLLLLIFTVLFLSASDVVSQDIAGGAAARPRRTFKLQLEVTAGADKVEGAKVLLESAEEGVRFNKETRTNREGIANASGVPEGKIHIQVIAKECETFGSFITLSGDQLVQVSLVKRAPSPSPAP